MIVFLGVTELRPHWQRHGPGTVILYIAQEIANRSISIGWAESMPYCHQTTRPWTSFLQRPSIFWMIGMELHGSKVSQSELPSVALIGCR